MKAVNVLISSCTRPEAYDLLLLIARGKVFGGSQPVSVILYDEPNQKVKLENLAGEVKDCASTVLREICVEVNPEKAFRDVDFAIMLDTIEATNSILERLKLCKQAYARYGKFLEEGAKQSINIVIAGDPVAKKLNVPIDSVRNVIIWGNSGPNILVDISHAEFQAENDLYKSVIKQINNDHWRKHILQPYVENKCSEKLSASEIAICKAKAIADHIKDIWFGTSENWSSMVVHSNGEYGIPKNIFFGFPISIPKPRGSSEIVPNLEFDKWEEAQFLQRIHEIDECRKILHQICEGEEIEESDPVL
ncbi:hypothetical protein ACTXT7_012859 [Hymenolepis weldensis]